MGIEADFEAQLAKEILASEKRRTEIMALAFAFSGVFFVSFSYSSAFQLLADAVTVRWSLAALFIFAIATEIGSRAGVRRTIAAGRNPPAFPRYAGAFLEVGIISAMVAVTGMRQGFSVFMPPAFAYAVIIIGSILRLDFWLPVFSGALAAVEYAAIAWWTLPRSHLPLELTNFAAHVGKAVIILSCGLVAGAVAVEVRKRALRTIETLAAHDNVRSVFGQHVSPEVVDRLLALPGATEIRHVCVMFLDIRDFTAFANGQPPEKVVEFLNSLFGFMVEVVNRHHGIINKFLGDGFMAVFGAPLSNGNDVANAVEAAREMVRGLSAHVQSTGQPATRIGIGLHCGEVVTGSVGSERRKEFTIIGEVVNLASRIEALNKSLSTTVLASDAVRVALGSEAQGLVSKGEVAVKGVPLPVRIFEVI